MSAKSNSSSRSFIMIVAAAIVVSLRLLAMLAGDARVWGVDVLRHLDLWWLAAFSILPLVAALPAVETRLSKFLDRRDLPWTRIFWGTAALLFAAVLLFPMDTFYYGDGGPLLSEIYKIGAQEHYSSEMLLNVKSAPLAGGLLHSLTLLIPNVMHPLGITLPKTPLFPFFALCMIGVVLLGISMLIEKDPRRRLPILLLVVGTGGGLFFFRYAEMYLPVFLAITAYLLAASAALRGDRPLWPSVLLFIIAVSAHFMALALLPSLLFLLLRRQSLVKTLTSTGRALSLSFAGMLALAFAIYFAFGFQQSDSRVIMPLLPVATEAGTLSYTLLSSYHLLDLVNILLLVAAFPLIYLLVGLLGNNGKKSPAKQHMSGGSDASKKDKTESGQNAGAKGSWKQSVPSAGDTVPGKEAFYFQLIAGYSFLLFLFFANTSLGLARDWDIAAPLGVMIVMVLVEFFRADGGAGSRVPAALLQAGIVAVLFNVPWVAANVNLTASTARFAGIMKLDDEHMYGDYALSGYEALRKQAVHAGEYVKEGEILQRMIEIVGYCEQYRMLLTNALYYVEKQPERYFELNDWMLKRLAGKSGQLRNSGSVGDYSITLNQIDSLAAVMAVESISYGKMQEMYPRILAFAEKSGCATAKNTLLGTGWYLEENIEKSIPYFAAVRAAGFRDSRIDAMYGSGLYVSGDVGRGNAEFQDGLKRYGDNPQYLFMVATSYLRRNERLPEARALLEAALSKNPPPEARAQIEEVLAQFP
ncbi:MAG: hypothetical protein WBQ23_02580 [Bacteroidota bacterium]